MGARVNNTGGFHRPRRVQAGTPRLAVGQVWADRTRRFAGRRFVVTEQRGAVVVVHTVRLAGGELPWGRRPIKGSGGWARRMNTRHEILAERCCAWQCAYDLVADPSTAAGRALSERYLAELAQEEARVETERAQRLAGAAARGERSGRAATRGALCEALRRLRSALRSRPALRAGQIWAHKDRDHELVRIVSVGARDVVVEVAWRRTDGGRQRGRGVGARFSLRRYRFEARHEYRFVATEGGETAWPAGRLGVLEGELRRVQRAAGGAGTALLRARTERVARELSRARRLAALYEAFTRG